MDKFISFEFSQSEAARSEFAHYHLGTTGLLPYYFGSIAPVNIFLGENNSGKSRFMREIIKIQPIKVFSANLQFNDILPLIKKVSNSINNPQLSMFYDIEISINNVGTANENFTKAIGDKFEGNGRFRLAIDVDESLNNLSKLINDRFEKAASAKQVLDAIMHNDNYFYNELQDFISAIERIRNLYQVFANTQHYGFTGHSYYDTIFQIEGNGSSVRFDVHYTPERFREERQRKHSADRFINHFNKLIDSINALCDILAPISEAKTTPIHANYIPTLRTARTFINKDGNRLDSSLNVMKYTTIRDYELKDSGAEIITGFELYDAILGKYAARGTKRKDLANFQSFLSKAFFNGKHVEIVPEQVSDSRGGNILITVGTQERDIHHLGDGIQAIILLLYPLFFARKGEWFFIEEPETHLHPGFQRLFIKTITKNQSLLDKELTVFMTTHSNHILDFAIDEAKSINLFTFRKTQEENEKSAYQIQLTKQGDLESLNVLGVQNSSVFLSNCTIWLEGVTDRIYLAAYLRAYLAHVQSKFSLIEGLHYSFLEYAGSNVMHYDFEAQAHDSSITPEALHDIKGLSISNRIMLIADQDGGKKTERDTRFSGQQHAGFEYRILEVREIENLLSKEVIVAALQKMYSKQTFDAVLLDAADYKNEYLGAYLRDKYPSLPDNFAPADGSGTIGSAKKRIFAERAAESITSWNDMTPEAQQLAEQVYQFIVGHNPRLTSN
jgi:predicted ATPase